MHQVYLVRHGQSVGQASNIVHDATTPISVGGQSQIESLVPFLQEQKITRIYASPLQRAVDSATMITAGLGIAYELDPDFGEWNYGAFDGSWEEHQTTYPQLYINSGCFDPKFSVEGGESYNEFVVRVQKRAEQLRVPEDQNSNVLVVSHFCALNIIANTLLQIPIQEEFFFEFLHGSVSKVTFKPCFPPRLSYSNRVFY